MVFNILYSLVVYDSTCVHNLHSCYTILLYFVELNDMEKCHSDMVEELGVTATVSYQQLCHQTV